MTARAPKPEIIHGWPAMMGPHTLMEYLDMGSLQTLNRHIRANPTFPAKDPRTGRWARDLVDAWVAQNGGAGPSAASGDNDDWRREFEEWAK